VRTNTENQGDAAATTLRPARSDDARSIKELLANLGYPSDVAQIERRIVDCTASPDTIVFVADTLNRIVGLLSFHCIPLFHADGSLGRITSLVVAPDYRRRGIGRLLVAAGEEFARRHGCARIEVTSGDHRPDAHNFYEHLGYRVDCRRFIKHVPTP
jgi:GNAT superfamily N-acetyltransferase